jgi:hypothetical protein
VKYLTWLYVPAIRATPQGGTRLARFTAYGFSSSAFSPLPFNNCPLQFSNPFFANTVRRLLNTLIVF